MKKLVVPMVLSIALICGCTPSSSTPELYAIKGSFNLTPQEYIDKVNEIVQIQEDSRYLEIPEFKESGDVIDIIFLDLTLKLETDSNGYITEIKYTWDGYREGVGYSLGLYLALTSDMIAPGNVDLIVNEMDMMDTSYNNYETSYTYNGIHFSYRMMGDGSSNYLTIEPVSSYAE